MPLRLPPDGTAPIRLTPETVPSSIFDGPEPYDQPSALESFLPLNENNPSSPTYRFGRSRRYRVGPWGSVPTHTAGLILSLLIGAGGLLSGLQARHPSPAACVPSLVVSLAIGLAVVRYWRRRRSRIWPVGLIGPLLAVVGLVLAIVR